MSSRFVAIIIVMIVLGVPLVWYLGSPLLVDRIVKEQTVAASTVLAIGQFVDAGPMHKGSGNVKLVETPGGSFLRLEDFQVSNGPDLRVYLAVEPQPSSRPEILVGYVDLGPLKGNRGDQNYAIPPEVELERYRSVVIYCRPFQLVFSIATLTTMPVEPPPAEQ